VYLLAGGGGLIYGLKYNNSKSRPLTIDRFNILVKRYFGCIAAVFNFQKYQSLKGKIPKPLFIETNLKNISDIMPKDGFVFAKH